MSDGLGCATQMEQALARINEVTEPGVIRAKLRGLLRGYVHRYAAERFEVLAVEQTVTADLYNPATSATSKTFILAGKKDVLIRECGHLWLMDHKTSSEDISDPNSAYWRQLMVEGQHHHYALLEHLNGNRVDGAIWDVTRKPGISPRQLTKAEKADLSATRKWFGDAISDEEIGVATAEKSDAGDTGRETMAMYEARLAWDCTESKPDWYFQRRRIARMDSGILEYASELWHHSQDMLWSRRQKVYPRNSGACLMYGGACKFLGICSGYDEPDSANWKRAEWVHPELVQIGDSDGKDVLTNSRVRCFQTCRRKEYYQYQLGLVRVTEEEREALFFGTAWHEAMAVIFEGYMKGQNDTTNNDESVTAIGCDSCEG